METKDCRTCQDFFEHDMGYCAMPCLSKKPIPSPCLTGRDLFLVCLFWGLVGSFSGMGLLVSIYWMLN